MSACTRERPGVEPTLDEALRDPALFTEWLAPYGKLVDEPIDGVSESPRVRLIRETSGWLPGDLTPPDVPSADSTPDQPLAHTACEPSAEVHRRDSQAISPLTKGFDNACELPQTPTACEPQETLSGEALAAWDGDAGFAERVCVLAGLRFEEGARQQLVIGDASLSVSLWLDTRDRFVFRVWDGWPEIPYARTPKSLKLAQLYAILVTRDLRVPRGPVLARWKRRALVETGTIPPPAPASLAELPANATPSAHATWGLVAELISIRRLTEPAGTSLPLSAPWLSGFSGGRVTEATIVAGKRSGSSATASPSAMGLRRAGSRITRRSSGGSGRRRRDRQACAGCAAERVPCAQGASSR
jgi:hypothetical protein